MIKIVRKNEKKKTIFFLIIKSWLEVYKKETTIIKKRHARKNIINDDAKNILNREENMNIKTDCKFDFN